MITLFNLNFNDHNSLLYFLSTMAQVVATIFAIIGTLSIFRIQFIQQSIDTINKAIGTFKNCITQKPIVGYDFNEKVVNSDRSQNSVLLIYKNIIKEWHDEGKNPKKYCTNYNEFAIWVNEYEMYLSKRIEIISCLKSNVIYSIILILIIFLCLIFSKSIDDSKHTFVCFIITMLIFTIYLWQVYRISTKLLDMKY